MADDFAQRVKGDYIEGATPEATDRHIGALVKDNSGNYAFMSLDASGNLKATGGSEYEDGDSATSAQGGVALGSDGTNLKILSVDSTGKLNVNVTEPVTVDGTVGISGDVNVTQGTDPWVVSATDLDTRDLDASTDNVAVSDGTNTLSVNGDGSINVVSSSQALDSVFTRGAVTAVKDTEITVVSVSPTSDESYGWISVTAPGYCEWQVKFGTTSSEATIIDVWTTPASPFAEVNIGDYLEVSNGETLLITATNRSKFPSTASDFTAKATLQRKV